MLLNWGNFPKPSTVSKIDYSPGDDFPNNKISLAYGRGRSYGDVCLNDNGQLVSTRYLDHFLHFDREKGLLRVESGVTIGQILQVIIPSGWFLSVLPGTKMVTVGGAIANDIHGKNHHSKGTFGSWVRRFGLLRSDRGVIECSSEDEQGLWAATIGGLGLTGIILWADLQLVPLTSTNLLVRRQSVPNLSAFFEQIDKAVQDYEYTVAWVDSLAKGDNLGRGVLFCANHASESGNGSAPIRLKPRVSVPCYAPEWLLNRPAIRLFNTAYYHANRRQQQSTTNIDDFFFPLDKLGQWNRLYGSAGFLQYQAVIPTGLRETVLYEILRMVSQSGQGAFLSVLKTFGDKVSPGLLSFPLPGVTVALDIPYRGQKTRQLLLGLDNLVQSSGGRLYPAKDACMSKAFFQESYPAWETLIKLSDPQCQSNFRRRLMES